MIVLFELHACTCADDIWRLILRAPVILTIVVVLPLPHSLNLDGNLKPVFQGKRRKENPKQTNITANSNSSYFLPTPLRHTSSNRFLGPLRVRALSSCAAHVRDAAPVTVAWKPMSIKRLIFICTTAQITLDRIISAIYSRLKTSASDRS